jgi:hypothetical protein
MMLMNDRAEQAAIQAATLSDLLSRWHNWGRNYKANQQSPKDPIFRDAKSGRGWDSTDDIIEDELMGSTMEAIDFQVSEMPDDIEKGQPYRSAIYVLARNLSTGRSVWLSPRLPKDPLERGAVVAEARRLLTRRLMDCGVM